MYFENQLNKRTTHLCVFFLSPAYYVDTIVPRVEGRRWGAGVVSQTPN